MLKFKMTESDSCPRCGEIETTKHLLWQCREVKTIWNIYNSLMHALSQTHEIVVAYEDILKPGERPENTMIKIKLIQQLIQIERPSNWKRNDLTRMINEILKIEKYNHIVAKNIGKYEHKWSKLDVIANGFEE